MSSQLDCPCARALVESHTDDRSVPFQMAKVADDNKTDGDTHARKTSIGRRAQLAHMAHSFDPATRTKTRTIAVDLRERKEP
ncbi:hypothetical protein Q7P35_002591 [Cladosporium inversicolor]